MPIWDHMIECKFPPGDIVGGDSGSLVTVNDQVSVPTFVMAGSYHVFFSFVVSPLACYEVVG